MSPGICFSFLLFMDDIITILICCNELDFSCRFTMYVSYFKVYFANQNEIVDVILILQMSMECQSFNKTCFLITEWAEKVEHVISLRLHLIAQNFIVNKILQLYPAVTLGETYDRQEQRRLSRMLIKFVAFTQQWSEMNQTWEQQKADSTLHTLDSDQHQHQGWSCPCSKWMVFVQDFTCQTHQYLAALAWRQHWSFCYQPAYSESKLIFLQQTKYPQTLSDNETSIW